MWPEPKTVGVSIRREMDTGKQAGYHTKKEAEIGVMFPQAKEYQAGRGKGTDSSRDIE